MNPATCLRVLRNSAQCRLTAALTTVFLVGGTVLMGVAYLLVKARLPNKTAEIIVTPNSGDSRALTDSAKLTAAREAATHAVAEANANAVHQILVYGLWSLAALTVLAGALGWWMAGRALRPVHTMIAGQRRFAANASHELRTPLAVQRAAIQIGLEDPTPAELAEVREQLLTANIRTQKLIDGLLLLASSESGVHEREPVRLDLLVAAEVARYAEDADEAGVRLVTRTKPHAESPSPVLVLGDEVLLGHLVGNLMRNAIAYNQPGGTVEVDVGTDRTLRIENSGRPVPPGDVARLFEPFERGSRGEGSGLGLSIVRAITTAHGGRIRVRPGRQGGLAVSISLR
ncbi:histidine kinase [Catenulispora acidiphila DSM 44928]|uniref:histidine kinase n=1 Tax=Catenulispora acidiphila (strain DSM 44928 / JCM 14897 / NBRC 102108 / NRRL B-24433 / ID139908) TaxID=479433 RepID=C7Q0B3_CATAD|nr:HAMP domain-containing sensor histidine kinase [Catenulispora acidiphila]ACU77446.1 histidine kinase [Catenulispora acidiphila DSM 44928]